MIKLEDPIRENHALMEPGLAGIFGFCVVLPEPFTTSPFLSQFWQLSYPSKLLQELGRPRHKTDSEECGYKQGK